MAMTTVLPRFFVLGGNSLKYLSVQENPPANRPSGFMSFGVNEIYSPRVKFAMEKSISGDETLVHIRCCYTNKYWVAHDMQGVLVIGASASKPEEDRTNPACTLFQVTGSVTRGLSFLCIAKNMTVLNIGGGLGLMISTPTFFPAVDWETLVILPSQVSFKSEELDGNYLYSLVLDKKYNYHRFEPGLDVGDPRVAHQLFPAANGNYRIKDMHFGKFWRRSPNWIWADAEENNYSMDTYFSFVKISEGVFALRNLGNNNFCGGLTTEGKTDCLNAQYPTVSRQTRLIVEERVLRRDIFNPRYRLSDSRIYEEEIKEVSHAFATNNSPDNETTVTLNYSSTDIVSRTWTHTVTVSLGVQVKFETSIIPFISKGEVEVSSQVGYSHEWAKTEATEQKREATYVVVVPPLTTMKVALMSTKAACDVPFSYTQRDLLASGEWVTTIKDDGVFTGINSYNFYFESTKVDEYNNGRIYLYE